MDLVIKKPGKRGDEDRDLFGLFGLFGLVRQTVVKKI